ECRDHIVRRGLGNLDEREAVGDLDRADVLAGQVRLAGDDTDEILRLDAGGTAGPHEQPRRTSRGRASAPLAAFSGLATAGAVIRPGQVDVGQFFFVALCSAGVAGQLHRGQCHLVNAEFVAERLDYGPVSVKVVFEHDLPEGIPGQL